MPATLGLWPLFQERWQSEGGRYDFPFCRDFQHALGPPCLSVSLETTVGVCVSQLPFAVVKYPWLTTGRLGDWLWFKSSQVFPPGFLGDIEPVMRQVGKCGEGSCPPQSSQGTEKVGCWPPGLLHWGPVSYRLHPLSWAISLGPHLQLMGFWGPFNRIWVNSQNNMLTIVVIC